MVPPSPSRKRPNCEARDRLPSKLRNVFGPVLARSAMERLDEPRWCVDGRLRNAEFPSEGRLNDRTLGPRLPPLIDGPMLLRYDGPPLGPRLNERLLSMRPLPRNDERLPPPLKPPARLKLRLPPTLRLPLLRNDEPPPRLPPPPLPRSPRWASASPATSATIKAPARAARVNELLKNARPMIPFLPTSERGNRAMPVATVRMAIRGDRWRDYRTRCDARS